MAYSGNTGLTRIIKAAQYSWQGFRAAYKHEDAFRQEVLLIVELLNSAVEAVVDRTGMERHKLSGRAKDMGSAAVTIAILNVIIIWGFMLS